MYRFLVAFTVLAACLYVCEAGMKCGIAGECPGINKVGEAFTGTASGKDYCCKTDTVVIPYCCTADDYAKYKWDALKDAVSAGYSVNQKVIAGSTVGAALLAVLF